MFLGYKPVQHFTVLNTVGNCNTLVNIIILCGPSLTETSLCGVYLYYYLYTCNWYLPLMLWSFPLCLVHISYRQISIIFLCKWNPVFKIFNSPMEKFVIQNYARGIRHHTREPRDAYGSPPLTHSNTSCSLLCQFQLINIIH